MKKYLIVLIFTVFANLLLAQMTITNGTSVIVKRGESYTNVLTINGSLTNNGKLTDAGSIGISQDYTNTDELNVEIGGTTLGTDYDQVSITGSATLTGTLNVTFVNGFAASVGNSFTIIDAAMISGSFTNVHLPTLAAGLTWATSYNFVAGTLIISVTSSVLPVELLDFSAQNIDNQYTKLDWRTAIEENFDFFTIERSRDGVAFEPIGSEEAKGNHSNYIFWDKNPYRGINYYRLKMIDLDGSVSYSDIKAVKLGEQTYKIKAFPTIVNDILNIKTEGGEITAYQIVNIAGQILKQQKGENLSTQGLMQIDLTDLPVAVYFLQAQNSEENKVVVKILKQ